MGDGERLWKVKDPGLWKRVGFGETVIRELIGRGDLDAVTVKGRLLVADSAVDEFIAKAKRGEVA